MKSLFKQALGDEETDDPGRLREILRVSEEEPQLEANFVPNEEVGFRCLHYFASEKQGILTVDLVKRVTGPVIFKVKTVDGTARSPTKYTHVDQVIEMKDAHQTISIEIIE